MKPLLKYPGGKGAELKYLEPLFPEFNTFVEPFLGGGAAYWRAEANEYVVNDISRELINIYKYAQQQDDLFIRYLKDIAMIWENKIILTPYFLGFLTGTNGVRYSSKDYANIFIGINHLPVDLEKFSAFADKSLTLKINSLYKVSLRQEISNFEENAAGVSGASVYLYLRSIYNSITLEKDPHLKTAIYFFLREYSYSSMFRYNSKGEFNVPFGGNTYSKKKFSDRVIQVMNKNVVDKLSKTNIMNGDFTASLLDREESFIFVDPPYDSEFSSYNKNSFELTDQVRLKEALGSIKKSKWMLVIKSTEFINELYESDKFYKSQFDKSYSVNFHNRNNKNVQHLVVTNYEPDSER